MMKVIPAWLDPFLTPSVRVMLQNGAEMEIQISSSGRCSVCGRKIAGDEFSRARNSAFATPDGKIVVLASQICLGCSARSFQS